jgi:hypothetical protein
MMSKWILGGLAWAGVVIVTVVILKVAQGNHAITADTATRAMQVVIGLGMAVYANFMTKEPMNPPPTERGGRMQAARRVTAWAMLIAGLAYAAAAALAPHPLDVILSVGAVGTAAVVSIGNAIRSLGGFKAK